MAINSSGLFIPTRRDVLDATQLPINLDAEDHKIALFLAAITPNFSSDTAYGVAPYNANEASGAGYTAGGQALTGTTFTESPTGSLMWDATDPVWTASTITAAGALIYADASAGNEALMLLAFGASYSSNASSFTILLPATGLVAFDLTPA
jgi:hypothetical protein